MLTELFSSVQTRIIF